MEDTLWSSLTDSYCKLPMALTAEKLADKYGITREDCDRFALASQQMVSTVVLVYLTRLSVVYCLDDSLTHLCFNTVIAHSSLPYQQSTIQHMELSWKNSKECIHIV